MKPGSLVEYIGGQDPKDVSLFGSRIILEKNTPYVVAEIGRGNFQDGWRPAIKLEEKPSHIAFAASMFREIQPPITLEDILETVEKDVLIS